MRILVANDGFGDAGGVETYLTGILPELRRRGHELCCLSTQPQTWPQGHPVAAGFSSIQAAGDQDAEAATAVSQFQPEVCFSHNMYHLAWEHLFASLAPTVKFMHGYFGTCVGGHKSHLWPQATSCDRKFGAACLAMYYPRRCGFLNPRVFWDDYQWARRQRELFSRYAAVVVASEHMRGEYVRNGLTQNKVQAVPLFPLHDASPLVSPTETEIGHVLFLGRITRLKGPDFLIRSLSEAQNNSGVLWQATIAGEGPWKLACQRLAQKLGVRVTFPGWVQGSVKTELLRRAWVLAVPSVWPEPFGLTGLEAGTEGVPAVGFDVGGISQWLHHGENGLLAPAGSVSGLAAALRRLAEEPDLRGQLSDGARAMARAMTLSRHVDHLEAIFQRVSRA